MLELELEYIGTFSVWQMDSKTEIKSVLNLALTIFFLSVMSLKLT